MSSKIILFDGICNFCNYWVNFIIRHDRKKQFQFASLQSEFAKQFIPENKTNTNHFQSVILLEGNTLHTKSTAALHIIKHLDFPWNLATVGILLPKFIRDFLYDVVARRRYQWFGKSDTCSVPAAAVQDRFIS
jgi:predicted DCC family thiol-disulfide oxidoreductase YuxK